MFAAKSKTFLIAVALLVASGVEAQSPVPEEPREAGSLLLPGRLPWGASGLPSGEVLAPCEDQTLSVLGPTAEVLTLWRSPSRFSAPVTVAPRGPVQLLAAPMVSGRVEVLAWDARTVTLASVFALNHPAEAVASAWAATGSLVVAWKDGRVESWNAHGELLWAVGVGGTVGHLLVDDSLGAYVLGPERVVLLDSRGREVGRWALPGVPRGVLQTLGGDLYIWADTGLWLKALDAAEFRLFDPSPLLGVVVDRQGSLILTEPGRLRRVAPDGRVLSVTKLPRPAVTGSSLDDRGRVLVGTEVGLEVWTYDGRWLATLDDSPPASAPLLTERGFGVWSSRDWKLHVWKGFRWPPFGWPQDGGGSGRPFSARRPASVATRAVNWTDDPDFGYFWQLVVTGEEGKQREVLERFEAKAAAGTLLETWPFANLVLLKIGRSGLTDLQLDRFRILNNWPALRLRAYTLLARTANPEDRDELIALIQREYDPAVAAQGTQALARSGWDGDGKLMRLLRELQNRMPDQAVVADAVIDAARTLWAANGQSADPVLVPLVSAVYQGPYPRSVKQKAQTFFQDLMDAP